jgi:hypothetical protein
MAKTGKGGFLFPFSVLMLLLSTIAVTLRFVCRGYILRVLGLSELFMLLTLVRTYPETHGTITASAPYNGLAMLTFV